MLVPVERVFCAEPVDTHEKTFTVVCPIVLPATKDTVGPSGVRAVVGAIIAEIVPSSAWSMFSLRLSGSVMILVLR